MSTLKTGALRGTSGTADSIQLHASNQSVTFPGNVTFSGTVTGDNAGTTWNVYSRTAAQLNGNNAITVTGLDGSEIKRLWFTGTNMSNDGSSGNNALCCRIGDSGGLETSGYTTTMASVGTSTGGAQSTGAWDIGNGSGGGSDLDCFSFTLVPTNTDGTGWVCEWHHGQQNGGSGGTWMGVGIGAKELSAELDRISFYWLGSNDFDSGFGQVFWLI